MRARARVRPREEGRFSCATLSSPKDRGDERARAPHQRATSRGSKLVACELGRRGLQVAGDAQVRREKPEQVKQPSHGQTATRVPRETVRVPSSARPGSVRVLLLVRTLREHLPEDRRTDSCLATCATLYLRSLRQSDSSLLTFRFHFVVLVNRKGATHCNVGLPVEWESVEITWSRESVSRLLTIGREISNWIYLALDREREAGTKLDLGEPRGGSSEGTIGILRMEKLCTRTRDCPWDWCRLCRSFVRSWI